MHMFRLARVIPSVFALVLLLLMSACASHSNISRAPGYRACGTEAVNYCRQEARTRLPQCQCISHDNLRRITEGRW